MLFSFHLKIVLLCKYSFKFPCKEDYFIFKIYRQAGNLNVSMKNPTINN